MTWSNWSGRQTATPTVVLNPSGEDDFVAAVEQARRQGLNVRAVGASHSHSRVAAPDGLLVETDGWTGVTAAGTDDHGRPVATIRGGSRIHQIGEPLYRLGLGLINQGDIDRQSIAGAIATGTHGTGPDLASFSTAVVGVRIVLADGQLVWCSTTEEPDLFAVARHSLGAVGLITSVDLAVRARYRLRERQWVAQWDDVMPHIRQHVGATRHFEFFWVPGRDLFACKSLEEVPADDDQLDEPSEHSPEPEVISKRERLGWSHRILPSERNDLHTEMEYAVPAEDGPECFNQLRDMIRSDFPELAWPVEYRTLAADDLLISAARSRPTVTISVHQDVSIDDQPLFSAAEEIFDRFDGRPHWGKVHYRTGSELARLHPGYETWWELRDRYDPDEMFVNSYLATLRP